MFCMSSNFKYYIYKTLSLYSILLYKHKCENYWTYRTPLKLIDRCVIKSNVYKGFINALCISVNFYRKYYRTFAGHYRTFT